MFKLFNINLKIIKKISKLKITKNFLQNISFYYENNYARKLLR